MKLGECHLTVDNVSGSDTQMPDQWAVDKHVAQVLVCQPGECQVCHKVGQIADWLRMGQIRDFFRSDLSTFWLWSEKSRICPIWDQSDQLWAQISHHRTWITLFPQLYSPDPHQDSWRHCHGYPQFHTPLRGQRWCYVTPRAGHNWSVN